MSQYRFVNLIVVWNIVVALICIPTAGKLVDVFGTPLSVTIFYFPFVYVFSDVATEVYGYAVARKVLWLTIAAQVLATIVFQFAIAIPPSTVMRNNQAFVDVLSTAPRLVFFGNIAVLAGDTVNNYVIAKLKVWSHGRHLPIRFVASTFLGQVVNTTIFYVFALGTIPAGVVTKSILVETLISVGIAVVFLPGSLAVSSWLKRTEQVDFFDTDTDFNPLKF
jgi:uncharacterized integral membrane protein (TIGR00697 family)